MSFPTITYSPLKKKISILRGSGRQLAPMNLYNATDISNLRKRQISYTL